MLGVVWGMLGSSGGFCCRAKMVGGQSATRLGFAVGMGQENSGRREPGRVVPAAWGKKERWVGNGL